MIFPGFWRDRLHPSTVLIAVKWSKLETPKNFHRGSLVSLKKSAKKTGVKTIFFFGEFQKLILREQVFFLRWLRGREIPPIGFSSRGWFWKTFSHFQWKFSQRSWNYCKKGLFLDAFIMSKNIILYILYIIYNIIFIFSYIVFGSFAWFLVVPFCI